MMPQTVSEPPKREGSSKIVVSVLVLTVMVFFFAFDAGQFFMNNSHSIGHTFSIGMVLAGTWVVKTILKTQPFGRSRAITFLVIAAIQAAVILLGFQSGKSEQYPAEQRAKVEEIQRQARQVRVLKENLATTRESFTEVEQLLSIEPMVASWAEHIQRISHLDASIQHDEIPPMVANILRLMSEALVFDKSHIENINQQISIVKASKGLSKKEAAAFYRQKLLPLIDQEDALNKQREASNLRQRMQDAARNTGSHSQ